MRALTRAIVVPMAVLLLTACASSSAPPETAASGPTLYQRLGGRENIKLIVDDFVTTMAADPRVNSRFKGLDKFKVGAKEQEELLAALGGMKKDIVGQ